MQSMALAILWFLDNFLRECALFRKRVLLEHVLAEYGLGYSVWFLDIFSCLVCWFFNHENGSKLLDSSHTSAEPLY